MADKQKFSHHVAAEQNFVEDGLRKYFVYRDLGISDASNGDVIAHVPRERWDMHRFWDEYLDA